MHQALTCFCHMCMFLPLSAGWAQCSRRQQRHRDFVMLDNLIRHSFDAGCCLGAAFGGRGQGGVSGAGGFGGVSLSLMRGNAVPFCLSLKHQCERGARAAMHFSCFCCMCSMFFCWSAHFRVCLAPSCMCWVAARREAGVGQLTCKQDGFCQGLCRDHQPAQPPVTHKFELNAPKTPWHSNYSSIASTDS